MRLIDAAKRSQNRGRSCADRPRRRRPGAGAELVAIGDTDRHRLSAGSQPFTASATGTTSATVTVTQPTAQPTIYVCHLEMTESGGTAISAAGSLTHTVGGVTLNFAQLGQLVANFDPCVPNDGQNMVATTPTSTGATNSAVTVSGYFN